MNNNDILIRIRYAFDLKDKEVKTIFRMGGLDYSMEETKKILIKSKEDSYFDQDMSLEAIDGLEDNIRCSNEMLERFLDGFITFKRGPKEECQGIPPSTLKSEKSVNNIVLKKLKIALSLTADDVMEVFKSVGVTISKSELGGLLRKEGHKHYRYCGDNYARKFLRGLGLRYRK